MMSSRQHVTPLWISDRDATPLMQLGAAGDYAVFQPRQ
jgi:hypothetical protein